MGLQALGVQTWRGDPGGGDTRDLAVHLAGHAVMELVTGSEMHMVRLRRRADDRGRCGYQGGRRLELGADVPRIEAVIMCIAAGYEAEMRLHSGSASFWWASDDIGMACAWAFEFGRGAGVHAVGRLQGRARELLEAYWDLVLALADELLRRGRLTPAAIEKVAAVVMTERAQGAAREPSNE